MPTTPLTVSQTTHALALKINNEIIGAVYQWSPDMTRAVSEHYEFGGDTTGTTPFGKDPGMPFEKVPGNVSGMRIEVARVDLFRKRFEAILPGVDMEETLAKNLAWFSVEEVWSFPDVTGANGVAIPAGFPSNLNGTGYIKRYLGCWFAKIGRSLSTTDDRVVKASSSIEYTAIQVTKF